MKEWVLGVGGTVVIITIIGFILPNGKIGKYIKGIMNLLLLLVIFRPIFFIDFENIVDFDFDLNNVFIQEDYIDYSFSKRNEFLEKECVQIIKKLNVDNPIVEIIYRKTETDIFMIEKVNIDLSKTVINSDKAHIDIIEQIRKNISRYLSIDIMLIKIVE